MKKLMVFGLAAVFAMTGMVSAQNLLSNGDFELMEGTNSTDAADWNQWGGDFNNRETVGDWLGNSSHVVSIGGWSGNVSAGLSQTVAGTEGEFYQLRTQAMVQDWWNLEGYLQIEFLDIGGNVLAGSDVSDNFFAPGNDIGLAPASYSLTLLAPTDTVEVRATLGGVGPGGTVRYDNAVLEVVPEPATLGLLGLSGLALWFVRRRA